MEISEIYWILERLEIDFWDVMSGYITAPEKRILNSIFGGVDLLAEVLRLDEDYCSEERFCTVEDYAIAAVKLDRAMQKLNIESKKKDIKFTTKNLDRWHNNVKMKN